MDSSYNTFLIQNTQKEVIMPPQAAVGGKKVLEYYYKILNSTLVTL